MTGDARTTKVETHFLVENAKVPSDFLIKRKFFTHKSVSGTHLPKSPKTDKVATVSLVQRELLVVRDARNKRGRTTFPTYEVLCSRPQFLYDQGQRRDVTCTK